MEVPLTTSGTLKRREYVGKMIVYFEEFWLLWCFRDIQGERDVGHRELGQLEMQIWKSWASGSSLRS